MGDFPSGQRGQTVNLLSIDFGGPNPPSPTKKESTVFTVLFFFCCEIDGKAAEQRTASGGAAAPSPIPSSTDTDGMLLNHSRVHQKKTGFNLSFFYSLRKQWYIITRKRVLHHRRCIIFRNDDIQDICPDDIQFLRNGWYTRLRRDFVKRSKEYANTKISFSQLCPDTFRNLEW